MISRKGHTKKEKSNGERKPRRKEEVFYYQVSGNDCVSKDNYAIYNNAKNNYNANNGTQHVQDKAKGKERSIQPMLKQHGKYSHLNKFQI